MGECILTAYCLAFNHEKYIRKTLEGFVNQKTEYRYKVIVHDDASTDGTADIIREYARRYPDIIVPIFQTENQYSKKVNVLDGYIFPLMEGKYTAICEGDDYWCDDQKLQLQISYMEAHPECSMCVHNTERIYEDGSSTGAFANDLRQDTDLSAEQIIKIGGGGLFHTSSVVYRYQYRMNKPAEFTMKRVGDYPLAIWMATQGTVHCLAQVMSKYRVMSASSWSKKMQKGSTAQKEHIENAISSLNGMDAYTNYQYTKAFQYSIKRYRMAMMDKSVILRAALTDGDYRKLILEKVVKKLCRKERK